MTEKFLMARNFFRIFTENNPVMGDSKTFGIPEAKGSDGLTNTPGLTCLTNQDLAGLTSANFPTNF